MQITISYGNRNNDDLLQYFGFVEVGCLFDRFVVLDPILILKKEIMNNSQTQNINERELRELQSAMIILEKESTSIESSKSIIVNRNEVLNWDISVLGSVVDKFQQKICLQVILKNEKSRIESSLNAMLAENILSPELNPCVLRTFLAQKIDVLEAASASLLSM